MRVECRLDQPPALPSAFAELWQGPDKGLIGCWLRGIEKAAQDPDLAAKAKAGELPVLAWKGGVEKRLKTGFKLGCLNYLATWQGLRGEDLNIDLEAEVDLRCSRTGMLVTFTPSLERLMASDDSGD
jgi:hypothetical protein